MLALIGVLTGLWRAAGVIPAIVYYAVPLISPGVFLLATFLLNCLVSVLTGTSFGTAATVVSICISMAGAMGAPLFAAGGVALSGAFFLGTVARPSPPASFWWQILPARISTTT